VTAPLTPHDPQPPFPDASDGESGRRAVRREVRDAVAVTVLLVLCGILLGLLWLWLAPRVPLVSDGSAIYLKDSEGEQAIGADGWFTLLGLGFGVVAGGAAFLWRRHGGVGVVVGLAVGGVLASLLAWRVGVWLGPPQNVIAHAKQIGPNKVFYAPLELRAKGALLAWPIAAVAVFLALTALFVPGEQQPEPRWEGWQDPQPAAGPEPRPAPGEAADGETDQRPAPGRDVADAPGDRDHDAREAERAGRSDHPGDRDRP
jgi:hypothetical protein